MVWPRTPGYVRLGQQGTAVLTVEMIPSKGRCGHWESSCQNIQICMLGKSREKLSWFFLTQRKDDFWEDFTATVFLVPKWILNATVNSIYYLYSFGSLEKLSALQEGRSDQVHVGWDVQGIKWEDGGRGSVVFVVGGQEPRGVVVQQHRQSWENF